MKSFGELFKRYRLKAEFENCTTFANSLAQKGYSYENSIFSHWQKGRRVPTNRHLLLKVIEIFIEKQAIRYKYEADEFLALTGLGYLTQQEAQKLFSTY